MSYEYMGVGPINYYPCHYGASKLIFRGPKKNPGRKYCVAIGGTETFGKYLEDPYPAQLAALCGRDVVNLGCMHAGAEVFLNNPAILDICQDADVTIVQLTSAQNMSNRFYSVHPRRNDRFIAASRLLYSIYPGLDFTNVHYTGHLVSMLRNYSETCFELIKNELQSEWVAKMQAMLAMIGGRITLLWLSDRFPGDSEDFPSLGNDPKLLDRAMIDQLLSDNVGLLEIVGTPEEISAGHDRMIFTRWEEAAARQMLGPIVHQEAARRLQEHL